MRRRKLRGSRDCSLMLAMATAFLMPAFNQSLGDIIVLKSGKQIPVDRAWQEGGKVRYERNGNFYGFSRDLVDKVESSPPATPDLPGAASQSLQFLPKTLSIEVFNDVLESGKAPDGVSVVRDGKVDTRLLGTLESEAHRNPGDMSKRSEYAQALFQVIDLSLQQGDKVEAIGRLQQYLAWSPDDLQAQLALGALFLKTGHYSQAQNILAQALVQHDDSADLNYLLGISYYLQEKNDLARRAWRHSLELKYRPEVEQFLKKIEGENKAEDNYRQANSLHFLLKYEGTQTNQVLGAAILATLERSYSELEAALDYSPGQSISVILYPDEVFRDITRTPNWVSALNDGKIRLPIKGVNRVDGTMEQMLKHELTHSFIRLKTGDSCPVWLNEGLAQVLAGESWRDFLPVFKKAASENKLPALAAFEGPFLGLSSPLAGWAYKQSALAADFLTTVYGVSDVQRLLGQSGRSADFNSTLKTVLRSDYADLQKELTEYILKQ